MTTPRKATRSNLVKRLFAAARQAAQNAYCPYSGFHVGAAVWIDGKIFAGCNVENASYGLTNCAERTALFSMVADGKRKPKLMALVTPDNSRDAILNLRTPCGACRQAMVELMDKDAVIMIDGAGDFKLNDLLPYAFHL